LAKRLSKETGEGMEQELERLITNYKASGVDNRMEKEVTKEMTDRPLMFLLGITLEAQEVEKIIDYINTRIMSHIYE
jgi:hypothetical protein